MGKRLILQKRSWYLFILAFQKVLLMMIGGQSFKRGIGIYCLSILAFQKVLLMTGKGLIILKWSLFIYCLSILTAQEVLFLSQLAICLLGFCQFIICKNEVLLSCTIG